MRRIYLLASLFALLVLCFGGCKASTASDTQGIEQELQPSASSVATETPSSPTEIYLTGIDKPIHKGMSVQEAVSVLGSGESHNASGVDYIFGRKWVLADGSTVHITFADPNYKDFMERLSNGEFILPDEIVEYTPEGTRIATPNEVRAFQEWYFSLPAQSAYTVNNGVKKTLF